MIYDAILKSTLFTSAVQANTVIIGEIGVYHGESGFRDSFTVVKHTAYVMTHFWKCIFTQDGD